MVGGGPVTFRAGRPESTSTTTLEDRISQLIDRFDRPTTTQVAVTTEPKKDSLNPAADGLSFGDLVAMATLLSLVFGLLVMYRRFRDDSDKRQKDTIEEIVREVSASVTPKLDTAVHELTNNSGSSVKDKTDSLYRDMRTMRADLSTMTRSVDKLTTQMEFWVRHTVARDELQAKLGERVAALEAYPDPAKPKMKGSRRWRS